MIASESVAAVDILAFWLHQDTIQVTKIGILIEFLVDNKDVSQRISCYKFKRWT